MHHSGDKKSLVKLSSIPCFVGANHGEAFGMQHALPPTLPYLPQLQQNASEQLPFQGLPVGTPTDQLQQGNTVAEQQYAQYQHPAAEATGSYAHPISVPQAEALAGSGMQQQYQYMLPNVSSGHVYDFTQQQQEQAYAPAVAPVQTEQGYYQEGGLYAPDACTNPDWQQYQGGAVGGEEICGDCAATLPPDAVGGDYQQVHLIMSSDSLLTFQMYQIISFKTVCILVEEYE